MSHRSSVLPDVAVHEPLRDAADQATPSRLELAELSALVRHYSREQHRWQPLVQYSPDRRWWTRLYGDDHADVWLLSWLQDQNTELHDHGDSAAAFTVVRGELTETRSTREGTLLDSAIRRNELRWMAPGVIHDVRNTRPQPAVSIHAYSPPLTAMTFYEQTPQGLEQRHTEHTRSPH
jgi:predicted metal-dependent enzyme (double-stranded beta helix superfamily)